MLATSVTEVRPGDDLAGLIADGLTAGGIGLADEDVLVVTQKVVSKAEGRVVDLSTVEDAPAGFARPFCGKRKKHGSPTR